MSFKKFKLCIEACNECASECEHCVTACSNEKLEQADCMKLVVNVLLNVEK